MRKCRLLWSSVRLVALITVVSLGAASMGCGGEAAARELTVSLREWEVAAGVEELPSGRVVLSVTNAGSRQHELVVVKTDLPAGELEIAAGKVNEALVKVAGRVAPLAQGSHATLELQLSGGKYVLLCNRIDAGESHYAAGMYTGLFIAP